MPLFSIAAVSSNRIKEEIQVLSPLPTLHEDKHIAMTWKGQ